MKRSSNLNRRGFVAGGFAAGAAVLWGNSAAASRLRVPRSHGPSTRTIIELSTGEAPGTIIISNTARTLDFVLNENQVARYRIALGREGFSWTGTVRVGNKQEWPSWRPPAEMKQREPDLPDMVPPGPFNPLGARAIYLFDGGKDTLYRIHGTNDSGSIGQYTTSGCFRLTNADVLELYPNVSMGTKVIVRD